ncbi:MAG: ABC transporter permease, partial [Planctomycetaceae bacterium]|nr:ABC transporter permease [Planctomycetaceae bacterium]
SVLALLVAVFSVTTRSERTPVGKEAGEAVVEKIRTVAASGPVLIVMGPDMTQADGTLNADGMAFDQAVRSGLEGTDLQVLETVVGSPVETRRRLEELISSGQAVSAVATSGASVRWRIFRLIPGIGDEKNCFADATEWPTFLTVRNLSNVASQTAVIAIIAIGMTLVIISGGIDLSVGSLVALGSVTMAIIVRQFGSGDETGPLVVVLAVACGVGICTVAGAFSGTVSTYFRIPAFIVTLSMMRLASGLAFRMSDGSSISHMPSLLNEIGLGMTLGIPNPVIIMIALYAIAHVIMTRTVYGRYVYAVGGNQEAARLSGVPVRPVLISVYVISGALAGLGGMILTGQLDTGDPKLGRMYELEVITAVVVGGASLMGGEGRILGTLIGALIIAVIKSGMNHMGIESFDQEIVLGAVLLATVLLDTIRHRRGSGSQKT